MTNIAIIMSAMCLQLGIIFQLTRRIDSIKSERNRLRGEVQAFAEWIYHIHSMNRGWWVQARDQKTGRFYQHPIPSWMRPIARQSAARIKKETGRE